jgi:hypothetical protein
MAKRSTPAATAANPDPFGTIPAPDEAQGQEGAGGAGGAPAVAPVVAEAPAAAQAGAVAGGEPPKVEAVEGPVPPEDPAVVLERWKQQRREALAQIAAEYAPLFETVRARRRAAEARDELHNAKQRAEEEYNRRFVELDEITLAASRAEGGTWDARAQLLNEYAALAGQLRSMGETVDPLEQ